MAHEPVDLEELARLLLRSNTKDEDILQRLSDATDSGHWARAVLTEVRSIETLEGVGSKDLKKILQTPKAGTTAGEAGLGCRGEGDFYIHRQIARIAGSGGVIGVPELDDSGIVRIPRKKGGPRKKGEMIAVAVDGVHSRLDHFPFLMGFHVARATLRDILASGARPLGLFSDIHIANDGDVGKVLDYTAGISSVGEALHVPLLAGSTLRLGGDLVLGGRLTGCAGSIGVVEHLTPRQGVRPKDILIMTEGSGGGTIATTALFNGHGEVVNSTLNLRTLKAGLALLDSGILTKVHSMTDVTNGGIRGDAFHIMGSSRVRIEIDLRSFRELIDPGVLDMLEELDIDPLGVSVDSLLLSVNPRYKKDFLEFFSSLGVRALEVGVVSKGKGVYLKDEKNGLGELRPRFREAPYTPIKKLVDQTPHDIKDQKSAIDRATKESILKKKLVLKLLKTR